MSKKQIPLIRSMTAAMITSSVMQSSTFDQLHMGSQLSTMGLGFTETPKPKVKTKYDKEAIRKADEKRKRKSKP